MTELSDYIQGHYGTCAQAERDSICVCMKQHSNQLLCEHYTRTTAETWEELLALARKRYESTKE